jgi:GT2 family glycosyltransferase
MKRSGELKILVVDNGSTDDSVKIINKAFGDSVKQINLEANYGYSYAVNRGIEEALRNKARSVLILNNDTVVGDELLINLEHAVYLANGSGIFTPIIYDAVNNSLWRFGDREHKLFKIPYRVEPDFENALTTLDYVTGCAVLITNDVFYKIGLFDERFFMYYEDADFCWRARKANFNIFGLSNTCVLHYVSKSTVFLNEKKIFWQFYSRVLFYRKRASLIYQPMPCVLIALKLLLFTFKSVYRFQLRQIYLAWKATWQACRVKVRA